MAVTDAQKRVSISPVQRRRSVAIALGLGALVVLFFAATMVQLKGNVAKRMQQEGAPSRTIVLPQGAESVGEQ